MISVRRISVLVLFIAAVLGCVCSEGAEDNGAIAEFVEQHCLDCHNSSDAMGELDLEEFDPSLLLRADRNWDTTTWEKIVRRLQSRQMPPAESTRPSEAEYEHAIQSLVWRLDDFSDKYPRPGRTESIRRLTRNEYQNAIADLLDLEIDVRSMLPADESSHGFDNVTVGELSPVLLNRYIAAAQHISRIAVGGRQRSPGGVTFRLPADQTQESHVEGLPLGTRGGGLVKHNFAQAGDYEIQLRLTRDRDENIEGLNGTHAIDVLIDRRRIHQFTIEAPRGSKGYDRDDTNVDANLKFRFQVSAGPHQIGVTFPRKSSSLQEIKRQPFDAAYNRHRHPRRNPAIFEISIVGPFDPVGPGDTPSRRRIFAAAPSSPQDMVAAARETLEPLVTRAYRRPATDSDLATPMKFFIDHAGETNFEAGMESALAAILVNPSFLLRIETDPEGISSGEVYRISDLELASRLSFFLWSSIPDERLLTAATEGRLRQPGVLKAEVTRMLADPRSKALVNNFAAQWLYLRNLDSINPDLRQFPDFDDNLRQSFRRETELMFASIVREDRSVIELLDSDETFLNERLATHYEIPHIFGSHFRRVKLDPQSRRGGLLRHGSILTVTSYATRTSPTIRGNWILENILGTPPPPQPPNVPGLKDKSDGEMLSVRERLAEHRANPACASCHDLMDPIGFALDNYDAVGRWREFEDGQPIDVSGILPDGTEVRGVDDLENAILKHPELFVQAMVEKLLVFGLARGIESYDGPAVREVVNLARADDYKFSSLILGIVESQPFQMRTAN